MIALDYGYIVVHFFSKEDYHKVLTQGPWIVLGHYLTVSTWWPNFCPSKATISSTLVWIRFPEMPIKFFYRELLLHIVTKLVKLLNLMKPLLQLLGVGSPEFA